MAAACCAWWWEDEDEDDLDPDDICLGGVVPGRSLYRDLLYSFAAAAALAFSSFDIFDLPLDEPFGLGIPEDGLGIV